MKLVRILILEDDLLTLSKLLGKLSEFEEKLTREKQIELSVVILSEYKQVEKYINKDPQPEFDIVLLDRDCKLGGSFHTLDIEKFGYDKVIGISSVPNYNEELKQIGINKIVDKDYDNLDRFSEQAILLMESMINSSTNSS